MVLGSFVGGKKKRALQEAISVWDLGHRHDLPSNRSNHTIMSKKNPSGPKPAHIAAFGAALSTLAVAPQAQAGAISLIAVPGSVVFNSNTDVNLLTSGSLSIFSFHQYNDSVGKTLSFLDGPIISANVSTMLTSGMFVGAGQSCGLTTGTFGVCFGPGASGTHTFGFENSGGNLGWFQLNLGGTGGPVTFLAGAYETTPGATIHVGTLSGGETAVPEPTAMGLGGLGLLALGATEIRRRRKARTTQAKAEQAASN